ncbi:MULTISPECIES: cell division protein FtsZ [Cysteiniphilum]|uniref:Cell division protein FtsZ n=1 Tax=Cysteiniphilum litorale TaxID=2056700 RepID=A0A8J3E8Y1_9GAMM|nr:MULTISPECIES: cell division protein FtsZ [Cysteiniphilum]GGF97127.1 cell division protein FtsZ [Cysteiniphilum litorale]
MFEISESLTDNAVIKVIGVGGGGGNAVEHMLTQNIEGVEFICANTDSQALKNSSARHAIQIGNELTKGLGAGANPEVGKRAAQEDRARIQQALEGADMVFITAGMGGGTGTGAAPVIAEVAKEMGILTVAVVTKPFPFEGRRRMQLAEYGISELSQSVDSLITIPNAKLLSVLGKNISLLDAFKAANGVLQGAVQGIAELITRPGLINVDFADVRTVMSAMGVAMMGTATASGENRAREAAEAAVASPLLEDVNLAGAKGVLVNITAGMDMSIGEFEEVGDVIKAFTSDQATVVVGTVIDQDMSDELRVTIVVTGLETAGSNATFVSGAAGQKPASPYGRQNVSFKAPENNAFNSNNMLRRQAPSVEAQEVEKEQKVAAESDNEYLDIPTFLRRKAD